MESRHRSARLSPACLYVACPRPSCDRSAGKSIRFPNRVRGIFNSPTIYMITSCRLSARFPVANVILFGETSPPHGSTPLIGKVDSSVAPCFSYGLIGQGVVDRSGKCFSILFQAIDQSQLQKMIKVCKFCRRTLLGF